MSRLEDRRVTPRRAIREDLRCQAAHVSPSARMLIAAAAAVALVAAACGASPSARLSKDLIPAQALQSADWGLRLASHGQTQNAFGVAPSGRTLGAASIARAKALATRQWIHGSGALPPGPLQEGIASVIDTAAQFGSAADAQALVADLSNGYGAGSSQPIPAVPDASLQTAPFTADVPGGQVTGREALVVIERGAYVFTVLVVGGGSRPTPTDAQALARLQVAAIPASLS